MIHIQTITDRAVRRLSKRLEPETIPSLCTVMTADAMGRPPLNQGIPEYIPKLRSKAEELQVLAKAPEPFLKGSDMIHLGFKPGKIFGILLNQAYELQLEGEIPDRRTALSWLKQQATERVDSFDEMP